MLADTCAKRNLECTRAEYGVGQYKQASRRGKRWPNSRVINHRMPGRRRERYGRSISWCGGRCICIGTCGRSGPRICGRGSTRSGPRVCRRRRRSAGSCVSVCICGRICGRICRCRGECSCRSISYSGRGGRRFGQRQHVNHVVYVLIGLAHRVVVFIAYLRVTGQRSRRRELPPDYGLTGLVSTKAYLGHAKVANCGWIGQSAGRKCDRSSGNMPAAKVARRITIAYLILQYGIERRSIRRYAGSGRTRGLAGYHNLQYRVGKGQVALLAHNSVAACVNHQI